MMDNLDFFLSSQNTFTTNKESSYLHPTWFLQAYQDLKDCFECVVTYHSAVEEFTDSNTLINREEIHQCDVERLKDSLSLETLDDHDFDYYVSMGFTPLKEVLKYPDLLFDKTLSTLLNQFIYKMLDNGAESELLNQLDQENDGTFPGLYLYLIHPIDEVCLLYTLCLSVTYVH